MKLEIAGKAFELARVPARQLDDCNGQVDLDALRIEIASGLHPDKEADTVLHEVLHALWDAYGLREKKDSEERIVTALAAGLLNVLKANNNTMPQFMRFKQGRKRKN